MATISSIIYQSILYNKIRMIKNIGPSDEYNLNNIPAFPSPNKQIPNKFNETVRKNSQDRIQRNTGNNFQGKYGQNQKYQQSGHCTGIATLQNIRSSTWKTEGEQTKVTNQESSAISIRINTDNQFKKQLERISAELAAKNEELRLLNKNTEKRKSEIIELEKNINYYEGRLTMMENELKKYEDSFVKMSQQCDRNAKYQSQVEELVNLFEGMRKQNENLSGKYEQKCYQLNKLTEKYIKLKNKLKNGGLSHEGSAKEVSAKSIDSRMKKSMTLVNRIYEPNEEDMERQAFIKKLSSKIKSIEESIVQISKENQRLFNQLNERDEVIGNLTKELQITKKRKYSKSLKKTIRPEGLSKNNSPRQSSVSIDTRGESQYQLFVKNPQQFEYPKPRIELILRKIKYNILLSKITYENLVDLLVCPDTKPQYLQADPYRLSQQEAKVLMDWVSQGKAATKRNIKESGSSTQEDEKEAFVINLGKRMGKFKNLMIKQQHVLKIQAYNTFLNRESEILDKIRQSNLMSCWEMEIELKKWGLGQSEIDVVLKGYYDETGLVEEISLSTLKNLVEQWQAF